MSRAPEDSDGRLVERIEAGDREAEEELCIRFYPVVMTYVSRRVREDAEDLCQEAIMVLLKAIRSRGLADRDRPGAFLFGVCRKMAIDRFRRRKREVALQEDWPLPGGEDPARLAEQGAAVEDVESALARLDGMDQEILTLRLRNELSYKAIARLLRIGEKTAMKRFSRARKRLLDLLAAGARDIPERPVTSGVARRQ